MLQRPATPLHPRGARCLNASLQFREILDVTGGIVWDDSPVTTTLVIVDDHAGFRRLARKLLEAAGYDVVGDAADGAAALAAVERLDPDVVLLDVLLPDTTGFEVALALSVTGGDRPRVVLTSSREESDFGERVTASAACGFISKRELTVDALAAVLADAA